VQSGTEALGSRSPKEEVMSTLLIVLLVLFVLGGGGWGYSRWRG